VQEPDVCRSALKYLFRGMYAVFKKYEIDTSKVCEEEETIIESICTDPIKFEQ